MFCPTKIKPDVLKIYFLKWTCPPPKLSNYVQIKIFTFVWWLFCWDLFKDLTLAFPRAEGNLEHLVMACCVLPLPFTIKTTTLSQTSFLTCCSGPFPPAISTRACPFSTWTPIEWRWHLEWTFTISLSRRFFPTLGDVLTRSDICGWFLSLQSLVIDWFSFKDINCYILYNTLSKTNILLHLLLWWSLFLCDICIFEMKQHFLIFHIYINKIGDNSFWLFLKALASPFVTNKLTKMLFLEMASVIYWYLKKVNRHSLSVWNSGFLTVQGDSILRVFEKHWQHIVLFTFIWSSSQEDSP